MVRKGKTSLVRAGDVLNTNVKDVPNIKSVPNMKEAHSGTSFD